MKEVIINIKKVMNTGDWILMIAFAFTASWFFYLGEWILIIWIFIGFLWYLNSLLSRVVIEDLETLNRHLESKLKCKQ